MGFTITLHAWIFLNFVQKGKIFLLYKRNFLQLNSKPQHLRVKYPLSTHALLINPLLPSRMMIYVRVGCKSDNDTRETIASGIGIEEEERFEKTTLNFQKEAWMNVKADYWATKLQLATWGSFTTTINPRCIRT